jgi:hypothetical protein
MSWFLWGGGGGLGRRIKIWNLYSSRRESGVNNVRKSIRIFCFNSHLFHTALRIDTCQSLRRENSLTYIAENLSRVIGVYDHTRNYTL